MFLVRDHLKKVEHDPDGLAFMRGLSMLLRCDSLEMSLDQIIECRKQTEISLEYLGVTYGYEYYKELRHAYNQALTVVGLYQDGECVQQ